MSFPRRLHVKGPRPSHVINAPSAFSTAFLRILVEEERTVHSSSQEDIAPPSFALNIQKLTLSRARLAPLVPSLYHRRLTVNFHRLQNGSSISQVILFAHEAAFDSFSLSIISTPESTRANI